MAVAQLVRAPGCGPGGRGFESPRSPHSPSPLVAFKELYVADELMVLPVRMGQPLLQREGLRAPTSTLPLDTSQATDSNTASRDE